DMVDSTFACIQESLSAAATLDAQNQITMKSLQLISALSTLSVLIACNSATVTSNQPSDDIRVPGRVMIIGMDGTRSDVIELANTPSVDSIRANGHTDLDAITGDISLSGPGWSSMLTGVWCDKHQVLDNDATWSLSQFDQYPHFMQRAEAVKPDLVSVSVSHWDPINDEILCADEMASGCGGADHVINVATDAEVRDEVVNLLSSTNADIVFMQFDDIDHAGHGDPETFDPGGFCPHDPALGDGACTTTNPNYLTSTETTDGYIGDVLQALYDRPNFSEENWLILVSPDHGGGGTLPNQHGFDNAQDRRTFFIISGQQARPLPGPVVDSIESLPAPLLIGPQAPTPGLTPSDAAGAKIVDIAATALFHLGIDIDPAWGLDGQAIGVAGAPDYEERVIPTCFAP
ncbi:MAG: alkaline phosphatase family protein, partial [Oceanococcus sp.]